jgi:hypothetical protein
MCGEKVMLDQPGPGLPAQTFDINLRAVPEWPDSTDRVHASNQAPCPFALCGSVQLRPVAALARVQGKTETTGMQQCAAIQLQRGYNRQLLLSQLKGEGMLFQYGFIAPASWPVKFCNQRFTILDADLVNTVFITVQCQ